MTLANVRPGVYSILYMLLCSDLDELLRLLGVGRERAAHPDRRRRSITVGCNYDTAAMARDWAQVKLRQILRLI